jgi:hypothetical protein
MSAKYQIFVSSTFEDLRKEREQVIKAALEMGHIPVGMEMFSAADEEQWRVIQRQIDQSDYYAVIVAHRYGSITDGISYTEKEYDYAVQHGIPVIGFIISDTASWPAQYVDTDPISKTGLDAFKAKVKLKPVGFWTTADDLYAKFSIAMMKLIVTSPRPGWVRAVDAPGPQVISELSRLSRENAELRQQLADANTSAASAELVANTRVIRALKSNEVSVFLGYQEGDPWEEAAKLSLYELYSKLAPAMQVEFSTEDMASLLAGVHRDRKRGALRTPWSVPRNNILEWLSDFAALGLVMPSQRKHAVSDKKEYWSLTELGRTIYARLRLEALEQGERTDDASPPEDV